MRSRKGVRARRSDAVVNNSQRLILDRSRRPSLQASAMPLYSAGHNARAGGRGLMPTSLIRRRSPKDSGVSIRDCSWRAMRRDGAIYQIARHPARKGSIADVASASVGEVTGQRRRQVWRRRSPRPNHTASRVVRACAADASGTGYVDQGRGKTRMRHNEASLPCSRRACESGAAHHRSEQISPWVAASRDSRRRIAEPR